MTQSPNEVNYLHQPFSAPGAMEHPQDIPTLRQPSLEQAALGAVSLQLSVALEEKQRALAERDEALRIANTDPLTGLLNRRGWEQACGELRGGALVVFIDVDRFKRVNDTEGHKIGDDVLADTAAILQKCLRETDVIARLGGDEFAAILPLSSEETVEDKVAAVNSVSKRLDDYAYEIGFQEKHGLGFTFGVVEHQAGRDMDESLELADAAMYASKQQRRGRATTDGR